MIFARFLREPRFQELVKLLEARFPRVQSGWQSDRWIWIFDGSSKVEIDDFWSHDLEIKAAEPSELLEVVLDCLQQHYRISRLAEPEPEGHE